ncbi:FRG domain-containing protein [Gorillibacterium timonense]|uniref:FRG domain-containing protein n=1 Tax=Gorillibacterium timonense TaxID=1689269 RepID=UPI00071DB1EA|nr:FRG domain-containing protein [Gorillibacterium timonense]
MEQANSIDRYLKLLERYNGYTEMFYRGQLERYPSIPPSIARDEGYLSNESLIFHESVKMKADEFTPLLFPLQKLSKLQHYGIPTRLVDVTVDPLIALYFAVENVDDPSDGNVHLYLNAGHGFDSNHARLLSLLATLPDHNIDHVVTEYKNVFGDAITIDIALTYIKEPIFIKHCDELKELNPRLYNQHGAFLICGNETVDKTITNNLKSLDTLKPNMTIRIPYEYKRLIKYEIDERYGINNVSIYPELPSVADYIKRKYKKENFSPDGKYNIVHTKILSHGFVRRISVIIVLNAQLRIDQIRTVAVDVMNVYKENQDVVWVYVAKTGEDYIVSNWVLRCQWISSKLDERYRPFTLKEADGRGYYWESGNSYSTLSDYYNEFVFDSDKNLFVYHQKVWDEFTPIYNLLTQSYKTGDIKAFIDEVIQQQRQISKLYMLLQDFGHSKNKEFDDFLYNYDHAVSAIDDLHLWLENDKVNERASQYQYESCLKQAKKFADTINEKASLWKNQIGVSDEDFASIDVYNRPKHVYQYTQTIPLNPNALHVDFNVHVSVLADKRFKISGTTNLFNAANIMLSVRQNSRLLGQDTSDVSDGQFSFAVFSNEGLGYAPGAYQANISLSVPDIQSIEFVRLAGIEYENLCGKFVERTGIGPTVNYDFEFEIK